MKLSSSIIAYTTPIDAPDHSNFWSSCLSAIDTTLNHRKIKPISVLESPSID